MLSTPFPVMFLLMFLQAKWPPEPRNHHTTNDRDWSWRAPDLSIMMSKLCSYMSTGSFVKWYIKHFKTTLNECTAWWKLWKYIYIFLMWRQIFNNHWNCQDSLSSKPGPCASTTWQQFIFFLISLFFINSIWQFVSVCLFS